MSPTEIVTWFGSQSALARALGVTSQAVNKWVAQGQIPLGRRFQLEVLTGGRFRVGPNRPRGTPKNNYQSRKKFVIPPIDNHDAA